MAALKRVEAGLPVPEICRELGISSATFYKWRAKFGGMGTYMMARTKEHEDENRRLNTMYLEKKRKAEVANEYLDKKVAWTSRSREMVKEVVQRRNIAIRLACSVFSISESGYRDQSHLRAENAQIAS